MKYGAPIALAFDTAARNSAHKVSRALRRITRRVRISDEPQKDVERAKYRALARKELLLLLLLLLLRVRERERSVIGEKRERKRETGYKVTPPSHACARAE